MQGMRMLALVPTQAHPCLGQAGHKFQLVSFLPVGAWTPAVK